MTESCLNQTDLRRLAEDGRSKLSAEFIPSTQLPHSCMEDKEHLQVYLRIRPLTSAETSSGESQDCVAVETPDTVLLKPPSLSLLARLSSDKSLPQTGQRFQFSRVYGPETTQSELFEGTVKDLVRDVLEGENSLVFTYGVSNSGKTFTFLGPDSEAEAGILPRALRLIFSSIGDDVFQGLSVKPHRCREFLALSRQQQADEAQFKNTLLKQLRENEKRSSSLQNTTNQTWFEGSSAPRPSTAAQDRIILDVKPNTKFSVWVSFCEIYNENIHDLLEVAPSGAPRRPALRLAQDANSNAYVKDLRWVQVSSAEEAFRVVKLGRRNQSFSSTRLNQLSSRSHSIFSIRILSIEDDDPPRVLTISELCLCDLAGSERCAKTQNKGERLKEAGNINASLLILGKCIKALRYNQQAKLLQHIPFRESKLTHYLQSFFCGRGKACMIVNINQCASMYDETLNVLKFSAVAQKVVVLISRPLPAVPSCSDSSPVRASGRRNASWETSLEDVPEDDEEEEEEEEEEEDDCVMQDTPETDEEEEEKVIINKASHEQQMALLRQLQVQLKMERSENLLLEARVREEISREFSELFSDMQKDYDERLVREREILEERAERRLEIFKNLTRNMSSAGCSADAVTMDRFLSCQASELPGASHFSLRSGPAEKKPGDDQNHRADEAEEKKLLLLQLQEKSVQVKQMEQQLEDLQKKVELCSQNSSDQGKDDSQLQEALAALQKEQTRREELMAALEYQTLGKEEALASLQEERRAREEAQSALEESRRQQQALRESESVQTAVEELEDKILDQPNQIHILTEELKQQQLHTPTFSSSDGVDSQLREEVSELRKRREEEEKKRSEAKQKLIQQLEEERKQREAAVEQQVRELQRKLEEQEELRVQLETQQEASNQKAEQLQLKLRLQQEAAEKLRDDLREAELHSSTASTSAEDLHRVNSDLQRELTSLREEASSEMEQMRREKDRQLEEKLAEMERRSAEREAELQKAERKVATLQENLHQSEQKVTTLQENLLESERKVVILQENLGQSEQKVTTLKENLLESEQKVATLQENLHQSEQKVTTLQENLLESERKVVILQENLGQSEQKVTTLKENLLESEKKVATLQEAKQKVTTLQEAEQQVATLQEKLLQSEQKVATLQKAEQQVVTLQEKLHQSEQKVMTLQQKEQQVTTLQEKLHQSEQKVVTLQEAEQQVATLKEKLHQLEQKVATLQKAEQQVATLQENLHESERKVATLKEKLHQSEQKVATLQKAEQQVATLQEKLHQSEQKVVTLQEAEQQVATLKEKLHQLEQKVVTLQEAEQQVATLKEKLHQLEQKVVTLQEAEQQVATLKEKLHQSEQKVVTLQEAEQQVATLKEKLHQLEQQVATLQENLHESERKVATLQEAKQQVTTLQDNLQEAEHQVTTLQEKLKESHQQDVTLQRKLQEVEEQFMTLQEKLQEAEQKVVTLQEKLQESERREEEESFAVQEVRRKEVERRQELMAAAHEALAEKDAEMEKKAGEISRLKLVAQEEAQQVKSLRLELQRKEDNSSDLREKLADYRKQVQQVQKEVSAMRAGETALKQKLSDAEKTKKQLQLDLSSRDRTIQQLRAEQQDSKAAQLYQEACTELQAKQRVVEDMRLALTEQEETQQQMEQVLDDKTRVVQELSAEVEKLKGKLLEQNRGSGRPSDDLRLARDEASRAQQSLKVLTEKQQAERRKWQEEKLSLIGQAKEAEDKRNQEMRKFVEDRERYCRQQNLLESRLEEKEAAMESWRAERDTLVAALEVQLQKLLASQADKDKLIKELQQESTASPAGVNGGCRSLKVAELQAALTEKEAEIVRLKESLQENAAEQSESSALAKKAKAEPLQPQRRETRSSASSRGSSGFPSVLESSEVSTETGRRSRFPRPELEISFSPLQPDRLALRRQGDDSAVTVKLNRTGRKRKSSEMEKSHLFRRTKRRAARQEEVETENRRNTRTKLAPKLNSQSEESATSQSSLRSRKDGTLQKIGDFLQRSPTVLSSGAKKMMSLVSGRADAQSASSSSSSPLRMTAKRSRKKLYRPEISCPMEMPPHPIINQETKDGDGSQRIKLRLRSRVAKC